MKGGVKRTPPSLWSDYITSSAPPTNQAIFHLPSRMFGHFLMLLSISSVLGGVSVRMPYANPAGVIYSNGESSSYLTSPYGPRTSFAYGSSYYTHDLHAPAVNVAPVASPIAHVPAVDVARLAPSVAHTAHVTPVAVQNEYYTHNLGANTITAYGNAANQVAHIAAPIAHVPAVAAPIAHVPAVAAPIAHVPAVAAPIATAYNGFVGYQPALARQVVPAIQHVPGVAHVPVTKYHAEPGVIQNVVDVHKPKIASRKYEIRRPAIEKQFYDIEERIVIRPVGSAVVELDQPISKSQRGPTVVRPATHAVVKTIAQPLAAVRTLPVPHSLTAIHGLSLADHILPGVHVHPINIQGHTESSFIAPTTQEPALENAEQPEFPPQELYPEAPQQPTPQQPQQPTPQQPQQPIPQQPQNIPEQQFDDADSVSIENPELLRSRIQSRIPMQRENQFFRAQSISQMQPQENDAEMQRKQFEQQFDAIFQRQQFNSQIQRQQSNAPIQRQQISNRQFQQDGQSEISEPMNQNTFTNTASESRRSEENPRMQANSRSMQAVSANQFRSSFEADIPRSSSSPDVIPSIKISHEQSISNQNRLIALLTGQGGISEVRGTGENTIGGKQVRTRVLSVTPAPNEDDSENEKVNTRRIVVNRPIQTVEEVDVLQPFTNIERVAVHRPALIKTAHAGVAQIPTSIPVHTFAHAY